MKKSIYVLLTFVLLFTGYNQNYAKNKIDKKKAILTGTIINKNTKEPVAYATVTIKGTQLGVTSNYKGQYKLTCPMGTFTVVASSLGYKGQERKITIKSEETYKISFEIESDVFNVNEVVVTGDRESHKRKESPTIVNVISPKLMGVTQSVTLSEGLNFSTGLRMETDCQNCGSSQVRMNGMEGQYSQILINSRPIFSGLAGVYGLELIPSSMLEKVEVVRGGGSAIYGSNAIAGTINLILKDPLTNSYELGINSGLVGVGIKGSGNVATDNSINFNASVVTDDHKSGLSVFGFQRNSDHFDVDGDKFSELTDIDNTTVGARMFNRFGDRAKLTFNYFHISETRRGGNDFDKPEHEAGIAESLKHKINTAALVFDKFYREADKLSIYASGQHVKRNAYYGAERDLSAYGHTKNFSYNVGASYNAKFNGVSSLVAGIENTGSTLKDIKEGYPKSFINNKGEIETIHTDNITVADQKSITTGLFTQYTLKLNKFTATLGARLDYYDITDDAKKTDDKNTDQDGLVFVPRVSLLYDATPELQLRGSFSQGYRAPQIFDEDLHIEIAGAKQIRTVNADDLKKETSNSFMLSADFNKQIGKTSLGVLVEGFYTKLNDAFVSSPEIDEATNVMVFTRENAEDGATIAGVNTEIKISPIRQLTFISGLTIQQSKYSKTQDYDNMGFISEKKFLRTPDVYGFATIDWDFAPNFELALSANFTGKMLTPYEGENFTVEEEALKNKIEAKAASMGEDAEFIMIRETPSFVDMGAKISYNVPLRNMDLKIFTGIKNIFQSYQDDFDTGEARDAGYIYGPRNPRTIYFGIKIGNLL